MKSRSDRVEVAILDHKKIAARIEAEEVRAGVMRGSWRYTEMRTWQLAIQDGLRKRHQATRMAELTATLPAEGAAES